jgi:hypothetical protein
MEKLTTANTDNQQPTTHILQPRINNTQQQPTAVATHTDNQGQTIALSDKTDSQKNND